MMRFGRPRWKNCARRWQKLAKRGLAVGLTVLCLVTWTLTHLVLASGLTVLCRQVVVDRMVAPGLTVLCRLKEVCMAEVLGLTVLCSHQRVPQLELGTGCCEGGVEAHVSQSPSIP